MLRDSTVVLEPAQHIWMLTGRSFPCVFFPPAVAQHNVVKQMLLSPSLSTCTDSAKHGSHAVEDLEDGSFGPKPLVQRRTL